MGLSNVLKVSSMKELLEYGWVAASDELINSNVCHGWDSQYSNRKDVTVYCFVYI